jgi:hypothetical protein
VGKAEADHRKYLTQDNNEVVFFGVDQGVASLLGAQHGKEGVQEDKLQGHKESAHDDKQPKTVVQGILRFGTAALAKPYGDHVRGADPKEHGKGHGNGHQGHYQGKAPQGNFVYPLAHKKPVNYIVNSIDNHPDNGRNGEPKQQLANSFRAQAACGIIPEG